jgi:hypothetical protein
MEINSMNTEPSQQEVLNLIPKRKGRKPKNTEEVKVWSDPEYRKQYYKNYYNTMRPKEYVTCECGTKCKQAYLYIHELTKHHKQFLDMKLKLTQQSNLLNNTCN